MHRCPAITHGRRRHLPVVQPFFQDVTVRRVVVDDQHRQMAKVNGLVNNGLGRLRPDERRREGERTAPVRLAFNHDFPAHQGYQSGGDGQAQAGAAVLPGYRGVLLLERAEDGARLSAGILMPARSPRRPEWSVAVVVVDPFSVPVTKDTRTTTSPCSVT